jgi:DNA polymerase elongation subunit (family B)
MESMVYFLVNDLDFTSIYPCAGIACNISRSTCVASVYKIEGCQEEDILDYFSKICAKKENVVELGNKYYNLPNYQQMFNILENEFND